MIRNKSVIIIHAFMSSVTVILRSKGHYIHLTDFSKDGGQKFAFDAKFGIDC